MVATSRMVRVGRHLYDCHPGSVTLASASRAAAVSAGGAMLDTSTGRDTAMTAAASRARLGDTAATFEQCYGVAERSVLTGAGVVRRYLNGRQTLTVLFAHDEAIAIASGFAPPVRPRHWLEPEALDGSGEAPRVLLHDAGWVTATPTCPLAAIKLLAELA